MMCKYGVMSEDNRPNVFSVARAWQSRLLKLRIGERGRIQGMSGGRQERHQRREHEERRE